MQQVSLAIALALKPSVLLLDEPTSACDGVTTLRLENTLSEYGIRIVLVSHDITRVERFYTCQFHLGDDAI